jgi:hypothetical protein
MSLWTMFSLALILQIGFWRTNFLTDSARQRPLNSTFPVKAVLLHQFLIYATCGMFKAIDPMLTVEQIAMQDTQVLSATISTNLTVPVWPLSFGHLFVMSHCHPSISW